MLASDMAAGVPATGIVAFTFTERAANELSARVHALVRQCVPKTALTGLYVGTIHAWCLQYLASQGDFYGYVPVDEVHLDSLVSRLYDGLTLEETYGLRFPKAIATFLKDMEVYYNEHLSLDQVPDRIRTSLAAFLGVLEQNRLLTFGGMIRHAAEHLEQEGPVAGLKALYVDEYQDVNPAQVGLIKAMLPADGKLVVVGDDLQCIYQWRGSDVGHILGFRDEFDDAAVFRLHTNYRSRPSIVKLGNKIAESVQRRDIGKVMVPYREPDSFPIVHWLDVDSDAQQASTVSDIVGRLHDTGVPWDRMAVLMRSVASWGQPFVDALTCRGIPVHCPILGRGGQFIDDFVVPLFGWLRTEHAEPRTAAEQAEAEEAADRLWQKAQRWVTAENAEFTFWESINDWVEAIETKQSSAYNVRGWFYEFLDRCGTHVSPEDRSLMVGLGIASQVIRSVEEIHRRRLFAQRRRTPRSIMAEVYYALIRNKQRFGESAPIDTPVEGVLVTTIHQAKGLEWPVVIIPMLVSGRFPVRRRNHETSFSDEIAGRYGTSLDDERRLFYVAATRARERLFLIGPASAGLSRRSRFLAELGSQRAIAACSTEYVPAGVWTLESEDLAANEVPPTRIGLSDLLIYVECPYQFGLRRVVAIQPSVGDELGFGKGLHELVQRRLECGTVWSAREWTEQVDQHVRLPYMSEAAERRSRQAIARRVRKLDELGVLSAEAETEVPVEVLLAGGLVHGVVDSAYVNRDGSVVVRDWKSSIHTSLVPRYQRQLQFYALALRQQGRRVVAADMVDVAACVERGELVVRQVDISERAIASLVQALENSLKSIASGKFPVKPSPGACSCCDISKLCPYGECEPVL